jgi:hypothetical protein
MPPPSRAVDGRWATVMVGRVPHDDKSGGDPLPAHRTDGDVVHARLCGERRHDIIPAPHTPRLAHLDEIVGKQRRNPTRIGAAHRVEQLELATDSGVNVVDVVHGADRTGRTEYSRDGLPGKGAASRNSLDRHPGDEPSCSSTRKEVPMSMFDTNVKIAGQAPRAVCPLAT